MNWFILVALVALLVLPGAGHAATLATPLPATSEAIFFWLQSESAAVMPAQLGRSSSLLSLSNRTSLSNAEEKSVAIAAFKPAMQMVEYPAPATLHRPLSRPLPLLEYHEAAHRTGIRTNRRLN